VPDPDPDTFIKYSKKIFNILTKLKIILPI
jgi:hypothetical protein